MDPATTKPAKKAKSRLTAVRTQEVSLVDHAANLTMFVVRKNADTARGTMDGENTNKDATDGDPGAAPAGSSAPALSMPQGAKDSLLQGIATAIDALSKIGDAVQGASVDESQPVPPDVLGALGQTAEMIEALENQYQASPEAASADGGATSEGSAGPPATDETGKALEVAKGMMVEDKAFSNCMKAAGVPLRMQKKLAGELAGLVAKAGRKMASSRLAMLKQVSALIGTLVKEVDDETAEEPGKTPVAAAAPPPPAPAAITAGAPSSAAASTPAGAPAAAPVAKAMSVADDPAFKAVMGEVSAAMKKITDVIESRKEADALIAKVNKALSVGVSPLSGASDSASPSSGGPIAGGDKKPPTVWPRDLAADVAAEAASKTNGAPAR